MGIWLYFTIRPLYRPFALAICLLSNLLKQMTSSCLLPSISTVSQQQDMGYWWGSNVSCLLSPHYLYASPPLPTCHSLQCNAFSQRLSQAKWGVKGIDALDVEPPVLMHFFQFTINVLEIALLDNPFVFSASRVEKQPFISCSDRAK